VYALRWTSLSLVLYALVLPFLAGLYPLVRFPAEQIDIQVYPDFVRVEGSYVYTNPFPFPVIQGLSLPLPVDATHPMPVEITVERVAPRPHTLPLRFILGRYRFDLAFAARETIQIKAHYRQQAPGKQARYILTTTYPWCRPLEEGRYRLMARGVTILTSNYLLTASAPGVLHFERTAFMPQHDWQFSWEVQPQWPRHVCCSLPSSQCSSLRGRPWPTYHPGRRRCWPGSRSCPSWRC
jgi:hypothetical protein